MKTLFVCATNKLALHNGEEYDAVVEVTGNPSIETIDADADRIKKAILGLHEQEAGGDDPRIICTLHGPNPYVTMLKNFQIILGKEKQINIELPFFDNLDTEVRDPETIEKLKKLG